MADLTTALMGAQAAPGMSGWGKIGGLFGNSDASYMKGQVAGATAAQKMATARRAVEKNLAIEAQAKRYEDQGAPDLAAMLRAEVNPQQFTGAQLDQQSMGWGNQAWDEAIQPDANLELLNRMNMVRDGKPVDLTSVSGDNVFSSMLLPESQIIGTTAQGLAGIAADQALVRQRDASARLDHVKADAGGFSPGQDGKYSQPAQGALERAFTTQAEDGTENFDRDAHADFLMWRLANPELSGNEALDRYLLEASGLGTGIHVIDPRKPGSMTIRPPSPSAPRDVSRPTTQAEYDALPSGALFIDPDDGRTYRKP